MEMKLSVIIAVYNEGSTVEETLDRVWNQEVPGCTKELVIVESNSSDNSRWLCQKFAKRINDRHPGAVKLVLQDKARGKGNAVRAGLCAASGDIVLIQDADNEYDTADYPSLVEPIMKGQADFVLGSRHLSAGCWKIRKFTGQPLLAHTVNFAGRFFHTFFNMVYGVRLTDPTTMYKVFRRSCIDDIYFEAERFDVDFELVAKLIRRGFNPVEVPVSYISRGWAEGKKVRLFRDPPTWIRAILRYRFSRLLMSAEERVVAVEERRRLQVVAG